MSSIVTSVFKATIGLLMNKGRDKAAERLKEGDVTDQKFRGLIVREIDEIKSKLDNNNNNNNLNIFMQDCCFSFKKKNCYQRRSCKKLKIKIKKI